MARWQGAAAVRGHVCGPATELMLDLAGVRVGSRVLDLGAGTGDQTLLAARRVGPGGFVLATDISATMLDLARTAIREAGLDHVATRVMDAQQLDLESASFDAVIARFTLQFIPDLQRALGEVHRVLKSNGKLAAMMFSAVEKNPTVPARRRSPAAWPDDRSPQTVPGSWRSTTRRR